MGSVLLSELIDRSFHNTRCCDSYLLLVAQSFPSKDNLADSLDHFSVVDQAVHNNVLNKTSNNAQQLLAHQAVAQLLPQTIISEDNNSLSHGLTDQSQLVVNSLEVVLKDIAAAWE